MNSKKELVDNLRREWKAMWMSKIDDVVQAESIADKTYEKLFIDRGLILSATRNFKPPEFREILSKYLSSEETERFYPDHIRGGVRKFIREFIVSNKPVRSQREQWISDIYTMKKKQQSKHGGRGWLHYSL